MLDGSPPCLAFSVAGKGSQKWGKEVLYSEGVRQQVDDLFFEFARLVKQIQPKTFVAENVVGLSHKKNLGYLKQIMQSLKTCGYEVKAKIVDPAQLGAPQRRSRLILIGIRSDIYKNMNPKVDVFPKPTANIVTVRDVLPNIVRVRASVDGHNGFVCAYRPSATIVASDHTTSLTARFSCGGWIEDTVGEQRKYTIDELKKIFTFPPDFHLPGTFEQQWERLGRSHLPLATYHIGKRLIETVLGDK